MRIGLLIVAGLLAWVPAAAAASTAATQATERVTETTAADLYPKLVTQPAWKLSLGITLNLTEGNSSTRLFGAVLSTDREGPINFFTLDANGQYGTTRVPSKVPNPEGATPAEREGAPGDWKFDENINNFLVQAKYGHYLSRLQTNYGYALQRFEGNPFAGYWVRYETQAGYGRRFWFELLTLRIEAGPDFTEDHQTDGSIRSRGSIAASGLASFKLGDKSTLNEELTHLRTLFSNDPAADAGAGATWVDHRTRSTTGLLLAITEHFHMQTSLQFEYASRPAPGAHPLDIRLTNAFLYNLP